jgi:Clostripain family
MDNEAEWTWLVYMAGDNNLEGNGRDDLEEMQQVGSTGAVKIAVQFDTEENRTTRYRVDPGSLIVLQESAGVNTGSSVALSEFIKWGRVTFPAKHYLLDVWNHGGGWENLPPDFNYESMRRRLPRAHADLARLKRALFRASISKILDRSILERAIAIDVHAHDYLDNQELHGAVKDGFVDEAPLDILGMDACLMNMLEVAYEMKDVARFMVGSEETEPPAGWPYAAILRPLAENPTMSPAELSARIVVEYQASYPNAYPPVTQSALDLERVSTAEKAVDQLAIALLTDISEVAGAVRGARDLAQAFDNPNYIDLGDFARRLGARLPGNRLVQDAIGRILDCLDPTTSEPFVIQNATRGQVVADAMGVSIYLPSRTRDYATEYSDLRMSKDGAWDSLINALFVN